ncbi:MAG: EAL domain-containing protein, partial [Clostridia bacterium]
YNKAKLFDATRKMLDANRDKTFVFLRFDVDRFQLINSFFGTAEGDKLLIYIADRMVEDAVKCPIVTYGRIESDVYALCLPYDKEQVEGMALQSKKTLAQFNLNYDIVPSIGLYVIDDPTISVDEIYNRATLAAKTRKGNYVDFIAYYNESLSASLAMEQEITNEMNFALENGQFEIYLQPKYNIHTNLPCGAEALVRWMHPTKGMLSPGSFIPIFERNGFITKLDYYVWEQACKCLQSWIKRGFSPYPISVNISRVNIYNPNLVDMLLELVNRYGLKPALLNLELTESAYADNPTTMKKAMAQLQSHGFIIMMDDFGSGYSSLSLLKDLMIDVLKIDMRFLSVSEFPGRGENIVASVIRMAKWLNIPVIAEGAEQGEQVAFLRSVGCDYVQGYYYARPMSVPAYEQLCISLSLDMRLTTNQESAHYCYDQLFSLDEEMKRLFRNNLQAAIICEYCDDKVELVRVNEAYYALVGQSDITPKPSNILDLLESVYRAPLLYALHTCAQTRKPAECEYMRRRTNGTDLWIGAKLRYVTTVGRKHILIGELTDITLRKEIDLALQKYKAAWLAADHASRTVLLVDGSTINRTILKKILQAQFCCLEAETNNEAIEQLQKNPVDLILLDSGIPGTHEREFFTQIQKAPEWSRVPVIMLLGEESPAQQAICMTMGASDCIVKPYIPMVVIRRVNNVLAANERLKEIARENRSVSMQADAPPGE